MNCYISFVILVVILSYGTALHDTNANVGEVSRDILIEQEETEDNDAFIRKYWGIQDVTTSVGKLFHYKIPSDAFSGVITRYEVYESDRKDLPKWLIYDEKTAILEGVPSVEDIGDTVIIVKAFDSKRHFASDIFTVEVFPIFEKNTNSKKKCKKGQDVVMMWVIIDKNMKDISPHSRVTALKNLAHFLNINYNTLLLLPEQYNIDLHSEALLIAGRGNTKHQSSNSSSILTWQIGCNEKIWPEKLKLVDSIKQYAKDGTLSEVLQLPVAEWRIISSINPFRGRRHVTDTTVNSTKKPSSDDLATDADYDVVEDNDDIDKDNDDDDDADEEEENDGEPEEKIASSKVTTPSPSPVFPQSTVNATAHHRNDVNKPSLIPYNPALPAKRNDGRGSKLDDLPIKGTPIEDGHFKSSSPDVESDIDEEGITEDTDISAVERFPEHIPTTKNTSPVSTTYETTKSTPPLPSFTPMVSKSTGPPRVKSAPSVDHNLQVLTVTAGKALEYEIPRNTFIDVEDGNTRNLTLTLVRTSGSTVSWIQLNPKTQILYLLPLESEISKWEFEIEAKDSDNMTARTDLEVIVNNPKSIRIVNFKMSLQIKFYNETYLNIDNQICNTENCYDGRVARQHKLLNSLSLIYGDTDASNISVQSITYDPFLITWTNDTLPHDSCDKTLVVWLLNVLAVHEWSDMVKDNVKQMIGEDATVEKLAWEGSGECSQLPPARPTRPPLTNFRPVLRNRIPPLQARVGELLLYKIPEDTFFDKEDGNSRGMKLTLLTKEHTPIPENNWLQFDSDNQEIYALPLSSDYNITDYQLVCTDKGDQKEIAIIEIDIIKDTKMIYNVEFSMRMNIDFNDFTMSVVKQRFFIERLAKLFDDNDTSAIVIDKFVPGSVQAVWHNKTLPIFECPESTILSLKQVLLTDHEKITEHVLNIMEPEYPVLAINVTPTMICEGGLTELHNVPEGGSSRQEIHAIIYSNEYFATFILPALIVAVMLFIAGLIACVLYKRRSKGKMSLADNERRSFRKKGIPVIFQDELEERLEPTNKTPIIMKEEKPPLPPPEYQKSPMATTALLSDFEDSLYQSGGTFRSNRSSDRNNRKQTPVYRKPPPYVPP